MRNVQKTTGIREIAEALSISIGTVDRALHARPGVSPKTSAMVLAMAKQLGYRPNQAARSLKLHRTLRIAVHLPRQIASFFDPLRAGIEAAAAALIGVQAELDFLSYPRLGHGDVELLESTLDAHYDGLIITPGNPAKVDPLITRLARAGTAVICVASDAPRSERLGSVAVDAFISGSVAAELLSHTLPQGGLVASITGDLTTLDHADKLKGFAATLAMLAPQLTLLPTIESQERPREAYEQTLSLLNRKPAPSGIYVSTVNSMPVIKALKEKGLLGTVRLVTTDLFSELVPLIETGKVLATLYQRPGAQAKVAFEMIAQHLLEGIKPNSSQRLAPHIVLRSNVPLFMKYL